MCSTLILPDWTTGWLFILNLTETFVKTLSGTCCLLSFPYSFFLCSTLEKTWSDFGARLDRPDKASVKNASGKYYVEEVQRRSKNRPPRLVLCILPSDEKSRYDYIKQSLSKQGILSQCLLIPWGYFRQIRLTTCSTIRNSKQHRTIATMIAQQLNAKLAGPVWKLNYHEVKFVSAPTMVWSSYSTLNCFQIVGISSVPVPGVFGSEQILHFS